MGKRTLVCLVMLTTLLAGLIQTGHAQTPEPVSLELVGQCGGEIYAAGADGDRAVVGVGLALVVLDVSDPARPVELGRSAPLPAMPQEIQVVGDWAYVAVGKAGLRVFSLADPARPVEVGALDTPGVALAIHVAGDIAYVVDYESLLLVSVADPTRPALVGAYAPGLGGVRGVDVRGSLAYVSAMTSLHVVSVAAPTRPALLGSCEMPGAGHVFVDGDHAYVGQGYSHGFGVVDVSDPSHPIPVWNSPLPSPGWIINTDWIRAEYPFYGQVYVADGIAYVATDTGVVMLSVADPAEPVEVGRLTTGFFSWGLCPADGRLYVPGLDELLILAATGPLPLSEIGRWDSPTLSDAWEWVLAGEIACTLDDSLHVFSVADPCQPREIGRWGIATPPDAEPVWLESLAVVGNRAYVLDDDEASVFSVLHVLSIADPTHPVEMGRGKVWGRFLTVQGSYAYVGSSTGQWQVVSIADPTRPTAGGRFSTWSWGHSLHVTGDLTLVFDTYETRISIVSMADPTQPREVGRVETTAWIETLDAAGSIACVAVEQAGLQVLSLADPTQPVEIGRWDTTADVLDIHMVGDLAFVVTYDEDYYTEVYVISLVDPTRPRVVARHGIAYDASGIPLIGITEDLIYMANPEVGLLTFRVSGVSLTTPAPTPAPAPTSTPEPPASSPLALPDTCLPCAVMLVMVLALLATMWQFRQGDPP